MHLEGLIPVVRHGSFVRAVRRNRQNLHAVFGLKLFLRGFQTAHRAAGDGQIRALFGKRFRQTEADALAAEGLPAKPTKFETDKEKLRKIIRKSLLYPFGSDPQAQLV